MSMVSRDSTILIVGGGGTIGSSTALHLARRGYTNIRLLDKFENPSANSAGNDINKVRRVWHGEPANGVDRRQRLGRSLGRARC